MVPGILPEDVNPKKFDRDRIDPVAVDESRTSSSNTNDDYQFKARTLVAHTFFPTLKIEEVYVVWFSKTLRNWKAMVSTTREDNLYYEVTYDGAKRQTYVDTYRKINNIVIPD